MTSVGYVVGQQVGGSGSSGAGSGSTSGAGPVSSGPDPGPRPGGGGPAPGLAGPGLGSAAASAGTSAAAIHLVSTGSYEVQASVDASEVGQIKAGDQVLITVGNATQNVFGTVSSVGIVATTTSGVASFPVVVAVTGSPAGVYPGATASLQIVYKQLSNVLLVPTLAINRANGATTVLVPNGGKQVRRTITTGLSSGGADPGAQRAHRGRAGARSRCRPGPATAGRTGARPDRSGPAAAVPRRRSVPRAVAARSPARRRGGIGGGNGRGRRCRPHRRAGTEPLDGPVDGRPLDGPTTGPLDGPPPVIELAGVTKTYAQRQPRGRGAARHRRCRSSRGEYVAIIGPVRVRQVDADAHPRLPRRPDRRHAIGSPARTSATLARTELADDPQPPRSGSSSSSSTCCRAAGLAQRRAAAGVRRAVPRPSAASVPSARWSGSGWPTGPTHRPGRAVRRPAAAGRGRPGAGHRAGDDPGRRADRQPRLGLLRRRARRCSASCTTAGRTIVLITHEHDVAEQADRVLDHPRRRAQRGRWQRWSSAGAAVNGWRRCGPAVEASGRTGCGPLLTMLGIVIGIAVGDPHRRARPGRPGRGPRPDRRPRHATC